MFKKLLILLCLVQAAYAAPGIQTEKPILCFPVKAFLKEIKEKYDEEPMIIGKTSNVKGVITALYINQEVGSFTVVEMDNEAACVISVGTDVRYRFPKSKLL